MNWIAFNPGSEPCVLTADLCAIYGCDKCPGYAAVRDLPSGRMRDTGDAPVDPDATVLCVHTCHQVPQEELESGAQGITSRVQNAGRQTLFRGSRWSILSLAGRVGRWLRSAVVRSSDGGLEG
jgi:hypothetical protein